MDCNGDCKNCPEFDKELEDWANTFELAMLSAMQTGLGLRHDEDGIEFATMVEGLMAGDKNGFPIYLKAKALNATFTQDQVAEIRSLFQDVLNVVERQTILRKAFSSLGKDLLPPSDNHDNSLN